MKIRGSVVRLSFTLPHPPEDNDGKKKKKTGAKRESRSVAFWSSPRVAPSLPTLLGAPLALDSLYLRLFFWEQRRKSDARGAVGLRDRFYNASI